jgi:hypothetical protein
MYVAERLVFVELHKTGGTHIGKWLAALAPGKQVGKHNRVPMALRDRFILGSVRNPWDWYVSLWGYGCDRKGAVYHTVTRGLDVGYLLRQLSDEMGVSGYPIAAMLRQAVADVARPAAAWRSVYRDANDAGAFREWLHMMMEVERRFDVAEGFGFSPISNWAGILSYRYLKLFTTLDNRLYTDSTLGTPEGARTALRATWLVRGIIRTEHLEEDLLDALSRAGYAPTEAQREAVRAGRNAKTNTSGRRSSAYYYDDRTIALVGQRESLIIAEHGYAPPVPAEGA